MRLGTDADTCRHELLNAFCEPLIDHSFREPKCFDNTALFGIIGINFDAIIYWKILETF